MYFQTLVMRCTSLLAIFVLVACGNKATQKKDPVPIGGATTEEFQFNRSLTDYKNTNLGVTGFIWIDSVGDFLKKGNYIIFERPNCFECGQVMAEAKTDISVVKIKDTSYTNTFKGWNWKLVKISGTVHDQPVLSIDRLELSAYSYPDYENSGYVPVTNDYLQFHAKDKDLVYLDAVILPKIEGYAEDISFFKLSETGLKSAGAVILHNGKAPNLSYLPPEEEPNVNAEIYDMHGNPIGNKKVRLYGVLDYNKTKQSNFTIQVEAIKIQE